MTDKLKKMLPRELRGTPPEDVPEVQKVAVESLIEDIMHESRCSRRRAAFTVFRDHIEEAESLLGYHPPEVSLDILQRASWALFIFTSERAQ